MATAQAVRSVHFNTSAVQTTGSRWTGAIGNKVNIPTTWFNMAIGVWTSTFATAILRYALPERWRQLGRDVELTYFHYPRYPKMNLISFLHIKLAMELRDNYHVICLKLDIYEVLTSQLTFITRERSLSKCHFRPFRPGTGLRAVWFSRLRRHTGILPITGSVYKRKVFKCSWPDFGAISLPDTPYIIRITNHYCLYLWRTLDSLCSKARRSV